MSKAAANPFAENEFTKFFDVSKVMEMPKAFQDFKMPGGFSMEAMMDCQKKNMQAMAAAQQVAAEGWQTIMRRQSETMRQSMKECSTMFNETMAAGTPEEKVAKQTDMAKSAFDRCMASAREMAEMMTKSQFEAMQVISSRMGECSEEMRCMMRSCSNAQSTAPNIVKVANRQ